MPIILLIVLLLLLILVLPLLLLTALDDCPIRRILIKDWALFLSPCLVSRNLQFSNDC